MSDGATSGMALLQCREPSGTRQSCVLQPVLFADCALAFADSRPCLVPIPSAELLYPHSSFPSEHSFAHRSSSGVRGCSSCNTCVWGDRDVRLSLLFLHAAVHTNTHIRDRDICHAVGLILQIPA